MMTIWASTYSAPEIITTGVLKKIFGFLRCFGAILAANMDKLVEMFFGQKEGVGLMINVFIITALGQLETKVFTCILDLARASA